MKLSLFKNLSLPHWAQNFIRKIQRILPVVVILLVALCILAGSYFRVLDVYEFQSYDWRFRLKPTPVVSKDIVMIEIWDDALEQIGSWPFSRQYHAILLDVLKEYGARSLGFDILFVESSSSDPILRQSADDYGSAYFCEALETPGSKEGLVHADFVRAPLIQDFKEVAKGVGHVNAVVDADGKRRRIAPVIQYQGKNYLHLGLLLAKDYLNIPDEDVELNEQGDLRIGDRIIPINEEGHVLLDFGGKWKETYHHVSFIQILAAYKQVLAGQKPDFDLNFLKDKVCFLGLTATATHDINPIPIDPLYPQVGIHADAFNNLMNGKFMMRLSRWMNLIILLLLCGIALLLARIPMPLVSLLVALLTLSIYMLVNFIVFFMGYIWIDLFYPSVCFGAIYVYALIRRTMLERKAREMLERELSIASKIQRSFLPSSLPKSELIEVAAYMLPAKHVGGDLYSIFMIDDKHYAVMCGDVSGKGMPAALFMAKSVSEFKFHSGSDINPANVLTKLNDSLSSEETSSGLFVTVNYVVFDMNQPKFAFSNGGHMPMLNVNADGESCEIDSEGGMPIALMPGIDFGVTEKEYKSGDIFVMYSDGISEARNKKAVDYEIERLTAVVKKNRKLDANGIKEAILADVKHFVNNAPQHDDMTVIVVKVK